MKRFLIHILIYGISLALSLKLGGICIDKASLTPLCMIVPSIIMALLWRGNDMPVNTSGDVTLTEEERRTMLLAASNTLYASVPLQILLIFTNAALQVEKNNKAAGTRARKAALELSKLLKEFRAASVAESKK